MSIRWTMEEIRAAARKMARRIHRPDLEEDLAQEILLSEILKPTRTTRLFRVTVDAVRELLGDSRSASWKARNQAEGKYLELDLERDLAPLSTEERMRKIDLLEELEKISPTRRMILWAYWIWGFNHREISLAIGLTEARVCQLVGSSAKAV